MVGRWRWLCVCALWGCGQSSGSGIDPSDSPARPLAEFEAHAAEVLDQSVTIEDRGAGTLVLRRTASSEPRLAATVVRDVLSTAEETGGELSMLGLGDARVDGPTPRPFAATQERPEELVAAANAADGVELHFANQVVVRVVEQRASGPVARVDGAITYAGEWGRSYWTSAPDHGFEEWLELEEGVAREGQAVARWTIEGGSLRSIATGGVHVCAPDGDPLVYVSAPHAWSTTGDDVPTRLAIEDGHLALYVDARGQRVLVDPVWVPTGSMIAPRRLAEGGNVAVPVPGGILFAGGVDSTYRALTITERYDIATGVWSSVGALNVARRQHTATVLADGRVLVTGGGYTSPVASAEIFDPATGIWSVARPMATPRTLHTATLLPDGRVLVVGGADSAFDPLASTEIYDPTTDSWTSGGAIVGPRFWHSATTLQDGRVLVTGGSNNAAVVRTSTIFDPTTNSWIVAAAMAVGRCRQTATLLPSGHVLVAGGNIGTTGTPSAEVYDPSTNRWAATGSLAMGRDYHTAMLWSGGSVLVVGGGYMAPGTEVFTPASGTWAAGPTMVRNRGEHVMADLGGNRVLVAGGHFGDYVNVSSAEVLVEDACGNGVLESGESCDDGNRRNGDCCSGLCAIERAGTVCRSGTGACDAAETCDGVTTICPADALASASTVCRGSANACDIAETCTGTSAMCPSDVAVTAGTACGGPPVGPCDAQDTCTGTIGASARCEVRHAAAGTTCRAAIGDCDATETCTGSSVTCPTDSVLPDGTACSDGLACSGMEVCLGGTCSDTPDLNCDDRDWCTADACTEPLGCVFVPIVGCCVGDEDCGDADGDPCTAPACDLAALRCTEIAVDCDDGDACTADSCASDGTCAHLEVAGCRPDDAAVPRDGGGPSLDAAVQLDAEVGPTDGSAHDAAVSPPATAGGCGCSAAGTSDESTLLWLGLVPLGAVVLRRRRRV